MKKSFLTTTIYVLFIMFLSLQFACKEKTITMENKIDNSYCSCDDKTIIKVLEDEPVFVRKGCIYLQGQIDVFFFELVNRHLELLNVYIVLPCGEFPEEYGKEGLSVKISGNVTSCTTISICGLIPDTYRIAPIHFFELESIKVNN